MQNILYMCVTTLNMGSQNAKGSKKNVFMNIKCPKLCLSVLLIYYNKFASVGLILRAEISSSANFTK